MPASLRDIKRRIRSVANTQQIAKAMEMMAAARLRRYQEKLQHVLMLEEQLKEMVAATVTPGFSHPLTGWSKEKGFALVFSSDRGLCGSYNGNVVRRFLEEADGTVTKAFFLGKKAFQVISFNRSFQGEMELLARGEGSEAEAISKIYEMIEGIAEKEQQPLYLCYTFPRSTARLETRWERFLPAELPPPAHRLFLYEPSREELCAQLFRYFLKVRFFRIFIATMVSEYSARMLAMQAAGKNAKELVEKLTLTFNKVRQAAITKEILEVVAGAEALKR